MIGYYNYTVILTYVSLLSSAIGIFLCAIGEPVAAVFCLMASGFCDMFDGKIAGTKKDRTDAERHFGIQSDSLSDIVCFCVLPACIGSALIAHHTQNWTDYWWYMLLAPLLILCGLIRLAYFNVTEEVRQKSESGRRKYYYGLPVTASAVIVPFTFCFERLFRPDGASVGAGLYTNGFRIFYAALLLATAITYITPLRLRKPYKAGIALLSLLGGAELTVLLMNFVCGIF